MRKQAPKIIRGLSSLLLPVDKLPLDQWATERRIVVGSARPGPWDTEHAPYTNEPMRALSDDFIDTVILQWAAQTGKSEVMLNFLLGCADQEPGPAMFVLPTVELANEWGGKRLENAIQAMPDLDARFLDKGVGRTAKMKTLPGGFINVVTAGSASQLASKAIKYLALDEIDKYPDDVDEEGNPIKLAMLRTTTYQDVRKILMCSTPSVAEDSAINDWYRRGDEREYRLPCLHCRTLFTPIWKNVVWNFAEKENEDEEKEVLWDSVRLACPECGALHTEDERAQMIQLGEWEATSDEVQPGVVSFRLSSICSPWITLDKLVQEWIDAQGDTTDLQTFINGRLAETWEMPGENLTEDYLEERAADEWDAETIPEGAIALTAGIDVQGDRLEAYLGAWDCKQRHFGIDHQVFKCSARGELLPWADLTEFLFQTKYFTRAGREVPVVSAFIDSGHLTQEVWDYCSEQQLRNVVPCKGLPNRKGRGIVAYITGVGTDKKKIQGAYKSYKRIAKMCARDKPPVAMLDVQEAKDCIMARAQYLEDTPRSMRWHAGFSLSWRRQLASEKRVKVKTKSSGHNYVWRMRGGYERNEALDCVVYALAAREAVLTKRNTADLETARQAWMQERGLDDRQLAEQERRRRESAEQPKKEAGKKRSQARSLPPAEKFAPPPPQRRRRRTRVVDKTASARPRRHRF